MLTNSVAWRDVKEGLAENGAYFKNFVKPAAIAICL